jgi:hypothetical protein
MTATTWPLHEFLNRQLGRRPAFLRPRRRVKGRCGEPDRAARARRGLVRAIGRDVNAILAAAGELPLPGS